jgi:hypothetical protein
MKLRPKKEGVTELDSPYKIINTINGDVTYSESCKKLAEYINSVNPAREAEVKKGTCKRNMIQVVAYNYDLPRE